MTNTLARIKKEGKNYEIIVDLDNALKFKKGAAGFIEAESDRVFHDSKKGQAASNFDLQKAFGTNDLNEITKIIVKQGEVLVSQEHRDAEQEKKFKQIVDFLVKNSVDSRSGNPHTPDRIKSALEQARVNIKNVPLEKQINDIVDTISKIIPIKISTKKIRIIVPAVYTGQAYGILNQYKESEKWKENGDLEFVVSIPSGIVMDFYDKLNGITHGSAMTEDIKEV